MEAAIHHDFTDSSDDDAPFVVNKSAALVEESRSRDRVRWDCWGAHVPPIDEIVQDQPSESETRSVELRPRRIRLVLCSRTGSKHTQLVEEAGSREGITEMVAEDTTDPVPDPLFVQMAGAMAFGL